MARIAGVDIPREKRLVISLTYVFGIGRSTAEKICEATGISESRSESLVRGGQGKVDIGLPSLGHLGEDLAGGRFGHVERLA